jgi:predicted MPP superfamily phosphohydrolase
MLARVLIFIAIVLLLFVPFNWITYRQLVRIHPKRRRWALALVIAGNLMWPLLPLLRVSTPLIRFARATLGPVWFAWTCFAIVYSTVVFLILIAWLPLRRRRTFAEFARWPSRVFLALVVIAGIAGFYDALVPLRVERVPLAIPNLPASLEGTRIALLGDLHVGLFTRPSRLDRIFTITSAQQPDLVILAGDLIDDDPWFVPKLLDGTRALTASTPLIAVLGNHEMYGGPRDVIAKLRGSRIRLLVNEGYAFRDLWIAGLSDYAGSDGLKPDFAKALAAKPATSLALVVAHQPKVIDEAARRRIPIALSAHTHGGQLGFRPLRWSLAGVFVRYHMGLYRVGATQLYINTGTGYWLVPFRLGMTPEITIIELRNVRRAGSSQ